MFFLILYLLISRRDIWQKNRHAEKNLIIRNPDVVLREEDPNGALLFNPDTNKIRVINTTGLHIWKKCSTAIDLASIITSINETFTDVPADQISQQVVDFVEDMKNSGFLAILNKKEEK